MLTAADVPGVNDAGEHHDEPLFPTEVMFRGHAVAWVLADSLEAAKAVAASVVVEYSPLPAIVTAALAGGVTAVQLREKNCSTRQFIELARELVELLRPRRVPLFINDRLDVALAVGADGVHLGQCDMAIADARRLAPEMIIGISAESVADAVRAEQEGADYIGISPVFATATKSDIASPLGLPGISEIRRQVNIPLVGIGGINETNAAAVIAAGADGIAVVSAIIAASAPQQAAGQLHKQVRQAQLQRKIS